MAERLLVSRKRPPSFLQKIVDRRDLQRLILVDRIHLEDVALQVIKAFIPKLADLPPDPVLLFPHGEVSGHRPGIKIQRLDNGALGQPLPLERLNLFEHLLVDHSGSYMGFEHHTGVARPWEFYLPRGWDFYLPPPWDFCLP